MYIVQAWIVGRVDHAIHWIYLFPVDIVVSFVNTYPPQFIPWIDLSAL